MKTLVLTILVTFQFTFLFSQSLEENNTDNSIASIDDNDGILRRYTEIVRRYDTDKAKTPSNAIGNNGFEFEMIDVGVNSKYSEFCSGFFRDKFVMVSSKKIGGLDKIDKKTNEGYKNLFCSTIKKDGKLKSPILFSRILNTTASEDQVSFSPDEHTIYFTRSDKSNSLNYKLYKANLERNSHGNWTNITTILEDDNYSYENPFVSPDGKKLYFSSNMPGGNGGYDLYVASIKKDGTIDTPRNLGSKINTAKDEKYATMSLDGKKLYFSSNGHPTIGGFDVFVSKVIRDEHKLPINLGNTINTPHDEVAFYLDKNNRGYVSSNPEGKFDILKFNFKTLDIIQSLEGIIVDSKTKTPLPNATIALLDEDGNELDVATSNADANYQFDVQPAGSYTIKVSKEGFEDNLYEFTADKIEESAYTKNLELDATKPIIEVVENKRVISIENIYFDYNKWDLKPESQLALDKIQFVLSDNPGMNIRINAHTDNVGSESFNKALSTKRANSAKSYLVVKGISPERVETHGLGESDPLIDCGKSCSEDDNNSNRRIEFIIINE